MSLRLSADVARYVVATDGEHRDVTRRALVVDDHVGGPGADLDQTNAELDLLLGQHALAGRETRAHDVFHVEARAVHALDHVLDGGLRAGDDVGLDLEPVTCHADRVPHAILAVHGVGPRNDVDDLAVGRDAHRSARLDHAVDVVLADLMVWVSDGDDPHRVLAPEVRAPDVDNHRLDALPGHALRGDGGGLDRSDCFFEVDDYAFAQAVGRAFAHAEDAYRSPRLVRFRDDHRDPTRAQVETDGLLPPRQNCAGTPPGTYGCIGRVAGIISAGEALRGQILWVGPGRCLPLVVQIVFEQACSALLIRSMSGFRNFAIEANFCSP